MIKFKNGLEISKYHPIEIKSKFLFPYDIYLSNKFNHILCNISIGFSYNEDSQIDGIYKNKESYNLILENDNIVIINDTYVVTLGHNIDNNTIKHPYFGTNKIIMDLTNISGWKQGFIDFTEYNYIIDPNTNMVSEFH